MELGLAWVPSEVPVEQDPESIAAVDQEFRRQLARWRLPPGQSREDLLQEAWLRWHAATKWQCAAAEGALPQLLGIARNVLREWSRRARRTISMQIGLESTALEGGDVFAGHEQGDLRDAVESWVCRFLPAKEVKVLMAVRWEGSSWAEAFALVGATDRRVASSMQRRISRFLSDREVQKSFVEWMGRIGLPFPSLPFPSLPFPSLPDR